MTETDKLVEALGRGAWEENRKMTEQYGPMPAWEDETPMLRDNWRRMQRAALCAIYEAGYVVVPRDYQLTPREKRIFSARHLESNPLFLGDLAQEFDVSRERIRQIEAKAQRKLRAAFSAPPMKPSDD